MEYQTPDKKTFNKTTEKESSIVRHLVFDQLIQSKSETLSGREHHNSAITIANYTFRLARCGLAPSSARTASSKIDQILDANSENIREIPDTVLPKRSRKLVVNQSV